MRTSQTSAAVQSYLDELREHAGEASAAPIIRELLADAAQRLRALCASLLRRRYPRLMRPPLRLEVDEMLSAVVERLMKALRAARPETVRQFFALANQHMRWELNEWARRLDQRPQELELVDVPAAEPAPSETGGGARTTRVLAAIDGLPEEEREVFGLVRIQGLTHAEAAAILGVATKTVQRRLNRSLGLLADVLGVEPRATG